MSALQQPDIAERIFAAREARTGRTLHPAERRIDVVSCLASMEHGKERLRAAIVKEQRRVAKRIHDGHTSEQMRVTPEMTAALNWLHELGMREATKELKAAGYAPASAHHARRTFAADRRPRGRVRRLLSRLGEFLPGITVRTRDRAIEANLAGEAQAAVMRAAARVPGALDAASRLVSSAFYGGMGDVFETNADRVVGGWIYSAVLDGGTCETCESADGTEYETWEDVQADLPDGGPNPDCDGDGRCRCRAVPKAEGE